MFRFLKRFKVLGIFLVVLLALVLFMVACEENDDDDNTGPELQGALDGIWQITMTPTVDSLSSQTTTNIMHLEEHGNSVLGHTNFHTIVGSRYDNYINAEVLVAHSQDRVVESQMELEIIDDDTIRGTGTTQYPAIIIPLQEDGTVHEKFQTIHDDWDGGEGGYYFYDFEAVRMPDLTNSKREAILADIYINPVQLYCEIIYSYTLYYMTDFSIASQRPFQACTINWDGGGFYIYGQNGRKPFTNSIYHPYEWVSCGHRTYNFYISLTHETSFDYDGYGPGTTATVYEPLHVTGDQYADQYNEMNNSFSNWAICCGYSDRTDNMSLYVLANNPNYELSEMPFVQTWVTWIQEQAPAGIWYFYGNAHTIHDTWGLSRDWTDECSSELTFTYLVGNCPVHFD